MFITIMWFFISAIGLWALAVNVNAENWGLSAIFFLVCLSDGIMLVRSIPRVTN